MPRMHNEETDLHKPLCFAINRSWLFKWFTRSSSDMYGDTLGNISSGLFSVERNGEIQGINLKLCCDLQYNIVTGATQSFVSGLLQVGEAQFKHKTSHVPKLIPIWQRHPATVFLLNKLKTLFRLSRVLSDL